MCHSRFWQLLRAAVFFAVSSAMALFALSIINLSATPSTLTLTSSDPSATSTKQATVSFTIKGSPKNKAWTVSVQSTSSSFTNCASVPASAVSVQCSNVGITGGGYLGTGACGSSFPLSTSLTQLAGGLQGDADQNYTVLINYVLTDAWRYPGANSPTCSLTLNYTVFAAN